MTGDDGEIALIVGAIVVEGLRLSESVGWRWSWIRWDGCRRRRRRLDGSGRNARSVHLCGE